MSLKVGDIAPDFAVNDQSGRQVKLSDFKGKKVVLYFYPKDNTPGCTAEACNLRDNYQALMRAGYVVLGVSKDDEKSHQKFIDKFELPFPLLADTDKNCHITHEKTLWHMGRKVDVWKEIYGKCQSYFPH
jgi:peroxiredoxin Q/BCP